VIFKKQNPNHIAVIMDGNRRWAKLNFFSKFFGHKKGVENVENLIDFTIEEKIEFLTVFALSVENMQRSKREINNLFSELKKFSLKWEKMIKKDVCISFCGNINKLPKDVFESLENMQKKTANCKKLKFALAINYSGKDEILRTCKRLIQNKENIDEKNFYKYLDCPSFPDVDLLIRTGGKKRISNFLLWKLAYAEILFLEKMWPDFDKKDFDKALKFFHDIKRNFGR